MPDRVPSDHDAVETIRATLERVGRTDRLKVTLPADAADALPAGDVVRLVLDGRTRHSRVETDFDGAAELRGAFDSPTLARDPGAGTDRLAEWADAAGRSAGQSVLLDVVTDGYKYGLRAPGERAVYEATEAPSDSLSSIARDLEE
ncbi:MAG: hypothetical protein ABEJ31_07575 [Haloarculaceae archaeon]